MPGGRGDRLGRRDREPRRDARSAGRSELDSRRLRANRASICSRYSGTSAARCASWRDDADLGLEFQRVVRADLGAEPVLQRGDDATAVGVVLGVGAGHDEHVERQPQRVAAHLDVALLHHVEHRHLDALGEVGQLVDRDDAAVCARDQAVGDGLRVAEAAALGHLDRVDVTDQVGHAGVGGGQLLGVAARCGAARPLAGRRPMSAARRIDSGVIGVYGCSPSSAPSMTGVHSSSRPDECAQQPRLALTALAEQHDVVAGDQGALELRQHGVLEAQDAGPHVAAFGAARPAGSPGFRLDAPLAMAGGT